MPDDLNWTGLQPNVFLVLAGGIALGAYEAGAYAGLHGQAALCNRRLRRPGTLAQSGLLRRDSW